MPTDTPLARPVGQTRSAAAIIFGFIALCAAGAVVYTFVQPLTTLKTDVLAYSQVGQLTYGAPVSPNSVYGTTRLKTGQPVYVDIVKSLSISYSYKFQSATPSTLTGTQQLVAVLSNGEGVSRTLPIGKQGAFTGTHFVTSGTLNLVDLGTVVKSFEAVGGQTSGGVYSVDIRPSVRINGHLGAVHISSSFNPPVPFGFSPTALVPGSTTSASPSTTTSSGSPSLREFQTTQSGSTRVSSFQPTVLFAGLTVRNGRLAALALFAAALILTCTFGWRLLRDANSEDETVRIAARYNSLLVEADRLPDKGVVMVEISSFADLVQVAQQLECPILHQSDAKGPKRRPTGDHSPPAGGDIYAVLDSGTLYCYMSPSTSQLKPGQLTAGTAQTT